MKVTDTFKLTKGYTVTFEAVIVGGNYPAALQVIWEPRIPPAKLLRKMADDYREARQDFMNTLAKQTGGTVAVVEV